jgi:hypothetical protein
MMGNLGLFFGGGNKIINMKFVRVMGGHYRSHSSIPYTHFRYVANVKFEVTHRNRTETTVIFVKTATG